MAEMISKSALAEHLGVSLPAVDAWVRRGCPIEERGGPGRAAKFDVQKVTAWLQRYTRAQTEKRTWGRINPQERHSIEDALRYVHVETLGTIGDAVACHDLPMKLAYAIEMQAGVTLLKVLQTYCKMIGISPVFLDEPGTADKDVSWEKAAEERGESYDEALWDHCYDAAEKRNVRLPRNGDEADA